MRKWILFLLTFPYTAWNCLVVQIMWNWFVPAVTGFAKIGFVQTLGFTLAISTITYSGKAKTKTTEEIFVRMMDDAFTRLIVLGFGYLVSRFL